MDAELVAWGKRVRGCEDMQLLTELQKLAREDRRCEVRVLVYLGEVDERKLYLAQGYSCLFRYVTGVLRMSEHQAYLRIQVARLTRQFPVVLDMLAAGEVNLSTLKLIGPHLSSGNHLGLLERARNKTKAEVELLVAEVAPKPDVPARIRKLPERGSMKTGIHGPQAGMDSLFASTRVAGPQTSVAAASTRAERADQSVVIGAESVAAPAVARAERKQRGSCTPLAPHRFELKMTAGQSLRDKLRRLQHLLRHRVPSGDLAAITELAFDLLIEKTLKQRFAQVSKRRSFVAKSNAGARNERDRDLDARKVAEPKVLSIASEARLGARSRHIPRAVLREVFARDGERCTFVSSGGHRCEEHGMLEVHHVHPFGLGGESTVNNLELVCRAHNQFFADQDFGAELMRRKRAVPRTCSDQTVLFGS